MSSHYMCILFNLHLAQKSGMLPAICFPLKLFLPINSYLSPTKHHIQILLLVSSTPSEHGKHIDSSLRIELGPIYTDNSWCPWCRPISEICEVLKVQKLLSSKKFRFSQFLLPSEDNIKEWSKISFLDRTVFFNSCRECYDTHELGGSCPTF